MSESTPLCSTCGMDMVGQVEEVEEQTQVVYLCPGCETVVRV